MPNRPDDETVSSRIETALNYALLEAAHDRAHKRICGHKPTPSNTLTLSAHYWARSWYREAADMAWRCVSFAALDVLTVCADKAQP